MHLLHVLVRLRCVARDAQHSGVTLLLCLSLSRHVHRAIDAPSAPTAGHLSGSGQEGRDQTHSCFSHPGNLQTSSSQCPEEHLWEDVVFFPNRERLRGSESWQNAQSSCLLRKGALTSDQVSCVLLFLLCGEGGIRQLGSGAAPSYPVVPTKLPSFPLSPAWQSISHLPAGTGALS